MAYSLPAHRTTHGLRRLIPIASALALAPALSPFLGCDNAARQQAAVATEDPVGEFEWGIERLKRTLRLSKPSGSDGLSVTDRSVKSELIPPSKANPRYTARVTITSETAFLHGKRQVSSQAQEKTPEDNTPQIDDPLADEADELSEVLDFPGVGPKVSTTSPALETRSVDNETVFELEYIEGRWQLTKEPELNYEKLWFKYAFE